MDVVSGQIHGHLIAVAVEGCLRIAHDEFGLAAFVNALFRYQVDEGGIVGAVHEGVIVGVVQGVSCKVQGQGVAVLAFEDNRIILGLDAQAVVLIAAVVVDEVQHLRPVADLHVGQIVNAVDKVQRKILVEFFLRIGAHVGGERLLDDVVVAYVFGICRSRAGKRQRECQQQREESAGSIHAVIPFFV